MYSRYDSIYASADQGNPLVGESAIDGLGEEGHFEPVNDEDIDFGDLPTATPAPSVPSESSRPAEDTAGLSLQPMEEFEAEIFESFVTSSADEMIAAPAGTHEKDTVDVNVTEAQEGLETTERGSLEAAMALPAAEVEQTFFVEEPITEGRRTEVNYSFPATTLD